MRRRKFRVAVVGAGFGGVLAGIKLKQQGIEDFQIFEKESNLGGTWFLNTYPGSGCDIPSHFYCYSFFPKTWSKKWSMQPEILRYMPAKRNGCPYLFLNGILSVCLYMFTPPTNSLGTLNPLPKYLA